MKNIVRTSTLRRGDLIAQLCGLEKEAMQMRFDAGRILAMRQRQSRQISDTIKALLLELATDYGV